MKTMATTRGATGATGILDEHEEREEESVRLIPYQAAGDGRSSVNMRRRYHQ